MKAIAKSIKERSRLTKEEWREYTKTVWHIANVTDPRHPAVFPEEIPRRLIKLFSFWGECVLDPFAGIGTTGLAALSCGRRVVCVDTNARYVSITRRRLSALNGKPGQVTVRKGDARSMEFLADESVGLIVTSPPYWNKADYGQHSNNLGNLEGYRDFFRRMEPALRECHRVLMPGRKICLVTANVNQYTNHGLLTFPLAADFTQMLRHIGFVMVTEVVWSKDGTGGKWGSYGAQRPIFGSYPYPPNLLFKNIHEFILVFAKPGDVLRSSPKAKHYESLMELPELVCQPGKTRRNG